MDKIKCLLLTEDGFVYNNIDDPKAKSHAKYRLDSYANIIEIFNPNQFDIDFILEKGKIYDLVVVCNVPHHTNNVQVRAGNVFALMQEPPYKFPFNYLFKHLEQYDKVFSNIKATANVKLSQPYLGWYYGDYEEHLKTTPPIKSKLLSCVMSKRRLLSGHRNRLNFLTKLKSLVSFDHFGKGFNFLPNKANALLPYYYSIAIENYAGNYYFTEKINDCFLAYTVPLYYGFTNIDKYFPSQSYIQIDINDIPKTINIIKEQLNKEDYQRRLPYLEEARKIVLEKYHLGAFFKKEILSITKKNLSNPVVSHPLHKSRLYSLLYMLNILIKKIKSWT